MREGARFVRQGETDGGLVDVALQYLELIVEHEKTGVILLVSFDTAREDLEPEQLRGQFRRDGAHPTELLLRHVAGALRGVL